MHSRCARFNHIHDQERRPAPAIDAWRAYFAISRKEPKLC
ncbi:MAG: hypothetical protein JWL84_5455 [Rhodospirillales bacterium]|nr:hypothetical protein [Rhodospirillales bacterium]